jgi:hypothetical protein
MKVQDKQGLSKLSLDQYHEPSKVPSLSGTRLPSTGSPKGYGTVETHRNWNTRYQEPEPKVPHCSGHLRPSVAFSLWVKDSVRSQFLLEKKRLCIKRFFQEK